MNKRNPDTWKEPLPHKVIDISRSNGQYIDLTGRKVGKVKVSGYLGKGKWQVQCECGNYCKKSKGLLFKGSKNTSCHECLLKAQDEKFLSSKWGFDERD